ncbi:uncharacterized protein RCC_08709 [Ramularia collo-cygni]|uniref:Uncharacterized protein n=1 Tax=Ramularia collo-cygni TaxID=112498 RepID=A0A2D3VFT3_9PEZI|nr:uncharacterized protein RCC_08709 [Ramularia collo-cygni]CZT23001.1 uncharacterized protein RCC_08709 [Ramularia collo-cygni]
MQNSTHAKTESGGNDPPDRGGSGKGQGGGKGNTGRGGGGKGGGSNGTNSGSKQPSRGARGSPSGNTASNPRSHLPIATSQTRSSGPQGRITEGIREPQGVPENLLTAHRGMGILQAASGSYNLTLRSNPDAGGRAHQNVNYPATRAVVRIFQYEDGLIPLSDLDEPTAPQGTAPTPNTTATQSNALAPRGVTTDGFRGTTQSNAPTPRGVTTDGVRGTTQIDAPPPRGVITHGVRVPRGVPEHILASYRNPADIIGFASGNYNGYLRTNPNDGPRAHITNRNPRIREIIRIYQYEDGLAPLEALNGIGDAAQAVYNAAIAATDASTGDTPPNPPSQQDPPSDGRSGSTPGPGSGGQQLPPANGGSDVTTATTNQQSSTTSVPTTAAPAEAPPSAPTELDRQRDLVTAGVRQPRTVPASWLRANAARIKRASDLYNAALERGAAADVYTTITEPNLRPLVRIFQVEDEFANLEDLNTAEFARTIAQGVYQAIGGVDPGLAFDLPLEDHVDTEAGGANSIVVIPESPPRSSTVDADPLSATCADGSDELFALSPSSPYQPDEHSDDYNSPDRIPESPIVSQGAGGDSVDSAVIEALESLNIQQQPAPLTDAELRVVADGRDGMDQRTPAGVDSNTEYIDTPDTRSSNRSSSTASDSRPGTAFTLTSLVASQSATGQSDASTSRPSSRLGGATPESRSGTPFTSVPPQTTQQAGSRSGSIPSQTPLSDASTSEMTLAQELEDCERRNRQAGLDLAAASASARSSSQALTEAQQEITLLNREIEERINRADRKVVKTGQCGFEPHSVLQQDLDDGKEVQIELQSMLAASKVSEAAEKQKRLDAEQRCRELKTAGASNTRADQESDFPPACQAALAAAHEDQATCQKQLADTQEKLNACLNRPTRQPEGCYVISHGTLESRLGGRIKELEARLHEIEGRRDVCNVITRQDLAGDRDFWKGLHDTMDEAYRAELDDTSVCRVWAHDELVAERDSLQSEYDSLRDYTYLLQQRGQSLLTHFAVQPEAV